MRPRSRVRRVVKWGGTGLCALIVIAWVVSTWRTVTYATIGRPRYAVNLDAGGLYCVRIPNPPRSLKPGWHMYPRQGPMLWKPDWDWYRSLQGVRIPFWLPLLLLLVPLALLWRRGQQVPPGHCHTCGYDLTGNVSGRCPECGTPVEPGKPRSGA